MSADIKTTLDGLNSILKELSDAHMRLSEKAMQLRDALVSCDETEIERLSCENERAASEIRKLENKRIILLRGSGLDLGDDTSFSSIEECLNRRVLSTDEEKSLYSLKETRIALAGKIHEVDHLNQLNITLAGQGLEFYNFCLQLLINASKGTATGYSPDGPARHDRGSNLLDGRA